jgi:glycosyltransferase involved in cell wall biosynthesis
LKIILAQWKKPWNETRLREKIGHALEKSGLATLYFFGRSGPGQSEGLTANVRTIADNLPLLAGLWQFFRFCMALKPDALIVASPALLIPSWIYRQFSGCRLVFDCQENFEWNFAYQESYPAWKSFILPPLVRFFLRNFFNSANRIWLAEKIYNHQMDYLPAGKWSVFENKVPEAWKDRIFSQKKESDNFNILFSGVLTEEAGLSKALNFMEAFGNVYPHTECRLIGLIPDRKKIEALNQQFPRADFRFCHHWAESSSIQEALQKADAVLIPYRMSRSNKDKFPTKMYEALFEGKPMFCQKDSCFYEIARSHGLGIAVDFDSPGHTDFRQIAEEIKTAGGAERGNAEMVFEGERLRRDFFGLFAGKHLPNEAPDE